MKLFVSDVHLNEKRPAIAEAFFSFMDSINKGKREVDALYILGDLFDFWAGDDLELEMAHTFREHTLGLGARGVKVFFIPGNRDFALGEGYASSCGMKKLPSPSYLIDEPSILLLHGDELCTDDISYQRYKKIIQHPRTLALLKRSPRFIRLWLARYIQKHSQRKPNKIYVDVVEETVEEYFSRYKITQMIHGHTHRPADHHYTFGERYVLSDWDEKGDYLCLNKEGVLRRIEVPIKR